jgi:hypothetical protein
MKSMRSSFALLLSTFGAVVLMANCTVKESSGDDTDTGSTCKKGAKRSGCECAGNAVGSQTCGSDGTFGACVCPGSTTGGSANNNGGESSTTTAGKTASGGNSTGGTYAAGGAGGDDVSPAAAGDGAGGEAPVIDPTDCETCLATLCPTQWDACAADPNCISAEGDGSGQYEKIMIDCVGMERVNSVVTRDKVRGCGFTMGVSSDPNTTDLWAPDAMAQSTADIMNCMAMGASPAPDASWANDQANFPNDVPKPWPAGTCAKLACTSQIQ